MSSNISHLSRVRALYKALLKLHRGLSVELQALGNQYVKDEFRAHKTAQQEYVNVFIQEWTKYYVTLAKQLAQRKKKQEIGMNLSPEMLDNFKDDQIGQLHELFKAATHLETEKRATNSEESVRGEECESYCARKYTLVQESKERSK